ncbi:hypothetical protein QUF64_16710 [Anaerolineales bacterium HSG6]|nr:hypothetical protein [Anaerolineales bacterium HSG6]
MECNGFSRCQKQWLNPLRSNIILTTTDIADFIEACQILRGVGHVVKI